METIQEWWGVAIGFKKDLASTRRYTIPHDSRFIEMSFKVHGPPITIINVYAPHAGRHIDERIAFADKLRFIYEKIPEIQQKLVIGDFNTRFHSQRPSEKQVLGPYIFGRGAKYLEQTESKLIEPTNRELLMDFLQPHDLKVMNFIFKASQQNGYV